MAVTDLNIRVRARTRGMWWLQIGAWFICVGCRLLEQCRAEVQFEDGPWEPIIRRATVADRTTPIQTYELQSGAAEGERQVLMHELQRWRAEHPGYTAHDEIHAFPPAKLWVRAGQAEGLDRGALYRDFMRVAGYLIGKHNGGLR